MRRPPLTRRGFTLIELVVVMAVLGLLLSLALPRFMDSLARGRVQVQQKNLATLREAIDKYYGDNGRYPDRLEDLVTRRYLRAIPVDPFSESPTWVVVPPRDAQQGGVYDVRAVERPAEDNGTGEAPAPGPGSKAVGETDPQAGEGRAVTVPTEPSAPAEPPADAQAARSAP
jgi:general secretion pathway protein G